MKIVKIEGNCKMDELKDVSMHHTAQKLTAMIKTTKNYDTIYNSVLKLVCMPDVDKVDMRNTLEEAIRTTGIETEIRNLVFQLVRSGPLKPSKSHTSTMSATSTTSLSSTTTTASSVNSAETTISSQLLQQQHHQHKQQLQQQQQIQPPQLHISSSNSYHIIQPPSPASVSQTSSQPCIMPGYACIQSAPVVETVPYFVPLNNEDNLMYLKRAGAQWDRRVRKSLFAMCAELKIPLQGQPRQPTDRECLLTKWEELSNYNLDLYNFRPVYAPKDLLEVLLSLKGPAAVPEYSDVIQPPNWEFSHIALPVKNLYELRNHYMELLRSDSAHSNVDYSTQAQRVLASRHAPLCQQLLRMGNTPPPYRGALWSFVLGTHLTQTDLYHWEKIKENVLNIDHIVDKLIFKDVQLTASNDDQYFVFEDVLYQVMLCFSRDTEIAYNISNEYSISKAKQYEAPPSGVVPFHGICMFAAPFCYLFASPIELYFTFRAFYVRYCHRLTTVNTHPQGIVSLCVLFEKLLQTHEPELWSHFRNLKIQPIRVIFKWIMRAFSGHLPPEQLLILWDLILGFDSLEILPLFALIILSFRMDSIMQVRTLDNIEAILADLSSIKVLPLIQLALSDGLK